MLLEQAMRSHMAIGLARKASSVGSVPVQDADDQTVPTYAREDIECDLRECSDPANLITFFSKEEFLNDFDGLMEQVLAEKELSQRFGKTCARK
jgi:hypothetical protein